MLDEHFCDCIGEFLETSFHCILYIRGVYPSCLFSKSIKYDIPVPISRSDLLTRYISNSIDSLKPHFLKDTIEKISLTILNKYDKPIEKFIFEISSLNNTTNNKNKNNNNNNNNSDDDETFNYYINIQKQNYTSNNNNNNNNNINNNNNKPNLLQLEASFKAYIIKILMTTDSFYSEQNFYKTQQSSSSSSSLKTSGGGDGNGFISNSDGVIHFNEIDNETYQQIKSNQKNKKEDNDDNNNGDKDLKFTIHVHTKPTTSNIGLNTNLSNVILNINPLESPRRTNTTINQITPVWISTTEKDSEIENSYIIPLNSNITDGKTTIRTFTEQSITK